MNTTVATMTHHDEAAEQQAWSEYLAALHAEQQAWTAAVIAWRKAVHGGLTTDQSWDPYQQATDEHAKLHKRERELHERWRRTAYPMFGIPLNDETPGETSGS